MLASAAPHACNTTVAWLGRRTGGCTGATALAARLAAQLGRNSAAGWLAALVTASGARVAAGWRLAAALMRLAAPHGYRSVGWLIGCVAGRLAYRSAASARLATAGCLFIFGCRLAAANRLAVFAEIRVIYSLHRGPRPVEA